ncbi:MAG: hypothetical protein LBG69_05630 [Zoogloeaceae bacterium]|nr:hypothetical protein [Zoogloeaceae bacterium]
MSAEELKQTISRAAKEKNWIVTPTANNALNASLSWRNGKHTIAVEIVCAENRYSITYQNSINMNYSDWKDEPKIHPYYNRYVKELMAAIRAALLHL